jgi:ABC-type nitrate/sulfonate/bicarbonate transport system substrate-binding protein
MINWFKLRITSGIIASLCAILLLLIGCSSCSKGIQTKQPVTIGYQEIALYRHLFTAKAKGYFDDEGVQVDIKPFASANKMMEGMIAGELDGTGLTNLQVGLTVEGKDPGRIKFVNFLVWRDKSFPDYILARSGTNINSIKDLEGHAMGLHPGSAVKAFNRVVLEHFNVDMNKGTYLELEPNTMQAAVVAGRVDALNCLDPVATNLIENGQCKVLVANPMKYIFEAPVPISGTTFTTKFLQERPEDAKKIMRALERAIQYMREPGHEEEIAGYIAKYTPINKELALKMNPSEYWTLAETDRPRVQALANRFQELQIVDKAGDVNTIILPTNFLSGNEESH